jgi:large conductance mechanosensitive channel
MLKEFKQFAMQGNMLDLAVGLILGVAFGAIVTSLVGDVIMPAIGGIFGGFDFNNLCFNLSGVHYDTMDDAVKAGAPLIKYGTFLTKVIDFVIVAFVIFLLVRGVNRMRKQPEAVPDTKACPFCMQNIPIAAKKCAFCTSEVPA